MIKLFADNGGGNLVFDLPMLQEDALMVLKLILNDQALKNEKVSFLSGARINSTKPWRSSGFAFVLGADDKGALENAIKNVREQLTTLAGDQKDNQIFDYNPADEDGFLIIVYPPANTQDIITTKTK